MQPGSMIGGRFQLVDLVAEGGLSVVWQGVQRSSEVFARPVAVKVMKRGFAAVGGPYLSMFLEEARIGATLQHANLIQVLDFIIEATPQGPVYCLVMEWVDGIDLRTLIHVEHCMHRQLSWGLVATVGLRVMRGLAAAHERRLPDRTISPVLHRDASPQNILLALNGDIKLADFGMARARDRIAEQTAPGFVKGTLSYMAPEIFLGKPATPASDIFSIGCTLWEALSGTRLFNAKSDADVVAMIRKCEIPSIAERRPDVPARMVAALNRALHPDPAVRFPTAREFAHELSEVFRLEGETWGDADMIVANAVAEAKVAKSKVPPLPPATRSTIS